MGFDVLLDLLKLFRTLQQVHRSLDVTFYSGLHQLLKACCRMQATAHAAGKVCAFQGDDWYTGKQGIARCGVAAVRPRIQHQVAATHSSQMQVLRTARRDDHARWIDAMSGGGLNDALQRGWS